MVFRKYVIISLFILITASVYTESLYRMIKVVHTIKPEDVNVEEWEKYERRIEAAKKSIQEEREGELRNKQKRDLKIEFDIQLKIDTAKIDKKEIDQEALEDEKNTLLKQSDATYKKNLADIDKRESTIHDRIKPYSPPISAGSFEVTIYDPRIDGNTWLSVFVLTIGMKSDLNLDRGVLEGSARMEPFTTYAYTLEHRYYYIKQGVMKLYFKARGRQSGYTDKEVINNPIGKQIIIFMFVPVSATD